MFEITPVPPQSAIRKILAKNSKLSTRERRQGIVGLIQDIAEIMPTHEMSEIILRELETNEYLHKAIEKIQGPEFQAVSEAILAMPEFADLSEKMKSVGIPVDCLMYQLQNLLGWKPSPCDCLASGQIEIDASGEECQ